LFICHILFIHSSVDGRLDWFRNLVKVNSTAINMVMQIFLVCWLWFLAYVIEVM
jgi:hypothetical protein